MQCKNEQRQLVRQNDKFLLVKAHTKKWTVRTMFHLLDLSLVNSWLQYREDCTAIGVAHKAIMQSLDFRLDIAEYYLAIADDTIIEAVQDEKVIDTLVDCLLV
jgi:hypothetical protein